MELFVEQDRLVRAAIDTDRLVTKELILRKKLVDHHRMVPKLKEYPYIVDVEYLCFGKDEDEGFVLKSGQGDLLMTDGKGEFVCVEVKSSYLCHNGSDRIFYTKTSKLIEQVQMYTAYQREHRPNVKVHGCGVTEQKIYWFDADGGMEEYWWCSGPEMLEKEEERVDRNVTEREVEDVEDLPELLQDLHEKFIVETLYRSYPELMKYDDRGWLTYRSKCHQKRVTVCREHIGQTEIRGIMRDYRVRY
jgi:Holliday junction resolvase-like predicted endonuclease